MRATGKSDVRILGIVLGALLLIVVPALGLALVKWLDVAVPQTVGIGAALVVGIGLLILVLAAVAAGFDGGAGERSDAFGLPPGTIRALIALAVLLTFVALVVYVLGSVLPAGDDRNAAAQQVVGVLGTLLAAIAAFYFGANAVQSGASALASLSPTTQPGPEAITKGITEDRKVLVANVNPNGLETRYFFEFTREKSSTPPTTYNESTPMRTLAGGDRAEEVREELDEPLETDNWMRVVAFNARGTSSGRHQQVGGS